MNPRSVVIVKCSNYDEALVEQAVRDSLEPLGGISSVVSRGNKVLLKVNLLAPAHPQDSVTTHPAVVKAAVKLVQEAGGEPLVADAPGYIFAGGKSRAMIKSGIREAVETLSVPAVQFESVEKPFISTSVPNAVHLPEIMAARVALEADVIISLPKLKTHSSTWYTGAIKNMFGAVATRTRKAAHNLGDHDRFADAIVDIFSALKPQLAIMDAVVGMEGEGPRHGRPRETGLIMASLDSVALDSVASCVIGFKPMEILTVVKAASRGLGEGDLGKIEVIGEDIESARVDYEKPSGNRLNIPPILMRAGGHFIKIEPVLDKSTCTRCEICMKSCPADAISMTPYPEIDRSICIQCFCCNEMCPDGAMEIKRSWLARRLNR